MRYPFLVKLLIFASVVLSGTVSADTLRIAAAANLRYVMPELVERYKREAAVEVSLTYAASGNLATQILHKAPYDIIFSANPFYIDELVNARANRGPRIAFAESEVVLFRNHASGLALDREFAGLERAIASGEIEKFAIANPRHAPYGQIARQLLQKQGVWEKLQASLLLGESASQTLKFAMTGDVSGAIVPYSYMTQPQIRQKGEFIRLPGKLSQQALIIKDAPAEAESFMAFVTGEHARSIWRRHGYLPVTGKGRDQ